MSGLVGLSEPQSRVCELIVGRQQLSSKLPCERGDPMTHVTKLWEKQQSNGWAQTDIGDCIVTLISFFER